MAGRPLKLRTFRIGDPARPAEGLRIGVTRLPPRGVPRARWRSGGYFDVWLPAVAPSVALRRRLAAKLDDPASLKRFFAAYEREMEETGPRQVIELLAELARRTPIAIGCYCEDESRCHRSRLRALIERAAGDVSAAGASPVSRGGT